MEVNKDYTQISLEELQSEEKKARREQITSAVLIGFLIGVIVFGVTTKGFGLLHTLMPVGLIVLFARNGAKTNQRLAAIRSELGRKRGS